MTWQIVAASTPGTSHIRTNLPCQDAHGYRIVDNLVIAAVADGLGTAAKADDGAKLAVETTLETLATSLGSVVPTDADGWEMVLRHAFLQSHERLRDTAEENAVPLRDYGTTLIAAVITETWLAVGHIGDGALVAIFDGVTPETVSGPQRGEYANEVTPLTSPDALEVARFTVHRRAVQALAMLTDGLQNLCVNIATGRPYEPFFVPFFNGVVKGMNTAEASRELGTFLGSPAICGRTDDDKTLVVIGRLLA